MASIGFRWLDILEKEFDKAFVDLDLAIGTFLCRNYAFLSIKSLDCRKAVISVPLKHGKKIHLLMFNSTFSMSISFSSAEAKDVVISRCIGFRRT